MFDPVIFREYDIRGIFNSQFDKDFAKKLAKSFVVYLKDNFNISNPTITLGKDARLSSDIIITALTEGLVESGAHVIQLGLVTSPVCYFSTFVLPEVDAAIQVTGSHNPPEYNGFKISAGKSSLFGPEIKKLQCIMEKNRTLNGLGSLRQLDIRPLYYERYKNEFKTLKPLKVVFDCGNGAAGSILRGLCEAVGIEPVILFEKPDGSFPNHHPDPTVEENLHQLKAEVLKTGAICGIGFDGDADRIGVVDHTGRMLYGDELMVIISRDILQKNPHSKIIGDVKCSDRLYQDIEKNGGIPIMWKTGHSLIKEKVKIEKAPFGGEMSGHIFFADRNYGYDDAPYAALRLIEILSNTNKTIPQLLEGLPTVYNTPEIRIDTTETKKNLIVEKMKEHFNVETSSAEFSVNLTDGIRLSFKNGWALCRASNTQPVLVVRYESDSLEGLHNIQSKIEEIINPLLNA